MITWTIILLMIALPMEHGCVPVEKELHLNEEEYPEEAGDHFEGDMLLDDVQMAAITSGKRNGIALKSYKWPKRRVHFEIAPHFDGQQISQIFQAMHAIQQATCIRFLPKTDNVHDFVYITGNDTGCYSAVGRRKGMQRLNLFKYCFRLTGTIIHELIHALGFFHQQSAHNRDQYVLVIKENIRSGKYYNFYKFPPHVATDFGIPYDYSSIMHYGPKAFSKNGQITIMPLKIGVLIGQRVKMSKSDIRKINLMYNCDRILQFDDGD